MKKIKAGDAISFRVPSEIDESLLKFINELKSEQSRGFSKILQEGFLKQMKEMQDGDRAVPLTFPTDLTEKEKELLKDEKVREVLSMLLYQMIRLQRMEINQVSRPTNQQEKHAEYNNKNVDFEATQKAVNNVMSSMFDDDDNE